MIKRYRVFRPDWDTEEYEEGEYILYKDHQTEIFKVRLGNLIEWLEENEDNGFLLMESLTPEEIKVLRTFLKMNV